MPGTYSKIYIQMVFAVYGRTNLIGKTWKDELYKYISGIITNKGQKSIIINGMPDHIHIFVGLKPSMAISNLVRDIKNNSSNFINEKRFVKGKFSWQEGYGAFSYGHSQINNVYNYILNQEKHHYKKTFKEEYLEFLQKFQIEFNVNYLFDGGVHFSVSMTCFSISILLLESIRFLISFLLLFLHRHQWQKRPNPNYRHGKPTNGTCRKRKPERFFCRSHHKGDEAQHGRNHRKENRNNL